MRNRLNAMTIPDDIIIYTLRTELKHRFALTQFVIIVVNVRNLLARAKRI